MAKLKIMLVDDEPDFIKVMSERLKSWGYDVLEFASPVKAIESAKKDLPGMVLLDYMMPEMDGVQALEGIRKISKDVPVIMLTAYPDKKSMDGTKKLGVSAYIPKAGVFSDSQTALKSAIDMVVKRLAKG